MSKQHKLIVLGIEGIFIPIIWVVCWHGLNLYPPQSTTHHMLYWVPIAIFAVWAINISLILYIAGKEE